MDEKRRWSLRGVTGRTIERVSEVSRLSGHSHGELIDEAVSYGYDQLPEENDDVRQAHSLFD